jgi:hypothetical protein
MSLFGIGKRLVPLPSTASMTMHEANMLRDDVARVTGGATVERDAEGWLFVVDTTTGHQYVNEFWWLVARMARQEATAILNRTFSALSDEAGIEK